MSFPRPLIIAHRGASSEFPENTLQSYRRAIEIGVDYIELDLHLSKDGIPVCHHDAHLPDGRPITQLSYAEITRATNGLVPSLGEVLRLERDEVGLMLELKLDLNDPKKLVDTVLQYVEEHRNLFPGPIRIGSLAPQVNRELSAKWRAEDLIGIAESHPDLRDHLLLRPKVVAMDDELVDEDLLNRLSPVQTDVWVWTVDLPDRARALQNMKVQGIITNDPARIKAEINQKSKL